MKAIKQLKPNKYTSVVDLSPPADGGFLAWLVLTASFVTNGLVFGVLNSFGLIYPVLEKMLEDDGCANAGSKAALVGAMGLGCTFLFSPCAGALCIFLGLRCTAVIGSLFAMAGLFLSSFFVRQVDVLYFTYGFLYAAGSSLAYTPSLAILGSYFNKRLGLANGFATIGSGVFTMILPPLIQYIIDNHGLVTLFQVFSGLMFFEVICSLTFKPIPLMVIKKDKNTTMWNMTKTVIDVDIWKIHSYRNWAICMPIALFGYFVPYVHIKKLCEINFPTYNTNIPLQCIAVTCCLGVLVGYMADKPWVNRVLMQQISFCSLGICTIFIPYVTDFYVLVVITLFMGVFDGAFTSLIGPIAIELCGGAHAASSIGCLLGLCAAPLCIGPPIAAEIFDATQSYELPFGLAGISPILGATLMFSVTYEHKKELKRANLNGATPLKITE